MTDSITRKICPECGAVDPALYTHPLTGAVVHASVSDGLGLACPGPLIERTYVPAETHVSIDALLSDKAVEAATSNYAHVECMQCAIEVAIKAAKENDDE